MFCMGFVCLTHNKARCWQRCFRCAQSTEATERLAHWGMMGQQVGRETRQTSEANCSIVNMSDVQQTPPEEVENCVLKIISKNKANIRKWCPPWNAVWPWPLWLVWPVRVRFGEFQSLEPVCDNESFPNLLQLMPSSAINANRYQHPSAVWNLRLTIVCWWIAPESDHHVICRTSSLCVMPQAAWRRPWRVVSPPYIYHIYHISKLNGTIMRCCDACSDVRITAIIRWCQIQTFVQHSYTYKNSFSCVPNIFGCLSRSSPCNFV